MASYTEKIAIDLKRFTTAFEREKITEKIQEHNKIEESKNANRREIYSIASLATCIKRRQITDFLSIIPTITKITVMVKPAASMEQRYSILPTDEYITSHFSYRMMGKAAKKTLRKVLILQTEHTISIESTRNMFRGRNNFDARCHLILEDITVKKNKDVKKVNCVDFFSGNLTRARGAVATMPQDKHFITREDIPALKKDFEGVQTELGFDYRLIMYIIGALLGKYLASGEVHVQHDKPAFININVGTHKLVTPGEIVFTPGCGIDDVELNTFCMLTGLGGGTIVLLLCDRIIATTKILSGYSLYNYICRLFRNIIYTSNVYGCCTEHLWAFMAGMHKVVKVYAHSDEGGAMRGILSEPVYPRTCGLLMQASQDVLGYQKNVFGKGHLEKRALLDMLLFFPNALTFSDTGNSDYPEYVPTTLHRPKNDPAALLSYFHFSPTFNSILYNMSFFLQNTFNITCTNLNLASTYSKILNKRSIDHHLRDQIIAPYQWVDPAVINIYDFKRDTNAAHFSYYSDVTLPFLPSTAAVNYNPLRRQPFLRKNESVSMEMPLHAMRNYGYSYILNSLYNDDDGLSELLVIENDDIASRRYICDNFLFSSGDPIIGNNKWMLPNCTFPNSLEMLPLLQTTHLKLCVTKDLYYPHPDNFKNGELDTIHRLSALYPVDTVKTKVARTRFFDTHFADMIDKMIECGFGAIEEPTVPCISLTDKYGVANNEIEANEITKVGQMSTAINSVQKTKNQTQANINEVNLATSNLTTRKADEPFNPDGDAMLLDSLVQKTKKESKTARVVVENTSEKSIDHPTTEDEVRPSVAKAEKKTVNAEQNWNDVEDSDDGTFQSAIPPKEPLTPEELGLGMPKGCEEDEPDNTFPDVATPVDFSTFKEELQANEVANFKWTSKSLQALEKEALIILNCPPIKDIFYEKVKNTHYGDDSVFNKNKPAYSSWSGFEANKNKYLRESGFREIPGFSFYGRAGGRAQDPDLKLYKTLVAAPGETSSGEARAGIFTIILVRPRKGAFGQVSKLMDMPDAGIAEDYINKLEKQRAQAEGEGASTH